MINGKQYITLVKQYYSFLIEEFNFNIIEEKIRGNIFYDIKYSNQKLAQVISISYENIEDYFQVVIFKLQNGKLPDYDDKANTLHLNNLSESIFPKINQDKITANHERFSTFEAQNELEKKLLKSAKELRLVLKYLSLNNN